MGGRKGAGGIMSAVDVCRLLGDERWTADCVRLLDGLTGGLLVSMYYH